MKTGKKIWSVLLALVLVFGMIVPVHAEDAVTITGLAVEDVTLQEGDTKTQTIPGGVLEFYDPSTANPNVTITYSDGTQQTMRWSEVNATTGYGMRMSPFDTVDWVGGQTYPMETCLLDNGTEVSPTCTFNVTIQAVVPTVTGMSIDPVTMTEGVDATELRYDDGTSYMVYDLSDKDPIVTITYSDDTATTCRWYEVYEFTGFDMGHHEALEATAQWTASETPYTWKVDLVDWNNNGISVATAEVSVTILPNPVESFSVESVALTHGVDTQTYTDMDGNEVTVYDFLNECDPRISVTFSDGRAPLENAYQWQVWEELGCSLQYADDLLATGEWEVGEHTFKVSLAGKTYDMTVVIEEDPIQSVSVAPVTAVQDWHTNKEPVWNEELQQEEICTVVNLWRADPTVTITFKDGSSVTDTWSQLDNEGYKLDTIYEETVKTREWVVGNTYETKVLVEGRECAVKVTYVENPLESITAEPLTLGTSQGWPNYGWDEQLGQQVEYRYYPVEENLSVKLTYKDGTTKTLTMQELWYSGDYGSVSMWCEQEQTASTPWLPGNTYKVYVEALGFEVECPVTIEDDSVAEISAEAQCVLYETLSAYANNLEASNPLVALKLANGKTLTVAFNEIYQYVQNEINLELETPQEGNALAAGTYNVVLTIDGVSCTFSVTVEKSPVKSFKITPKYAFTEKVHGWTETAVDAEGKEVTYFCYDYTALPYTVELTLADGTVETYSDNETDLQALYEKYGSNQVWPWFEQEPGDIPGPGTYTVEVQFMGMKQEHTISVVGSTIKSVTGSYNGKLIEGMDSWDEYDENGNKFTVYSPNTSAMRFTITYTDGTVETVSLEDTVLGNRLSSTFGVSLEQFKETPWTVGKNTLEVSVLGFDIEMEVEVVKNDYKKLTISNENGFTVKLEKTDGTVETYVATDFLVDHVYETYAYGTLVTDKGSLHVNMRFTDDTLQSIAYMDYAELTSNKLADCTWIAKKLLTRSYGSAPQASLGLDMKEMKELVAEEGETLSRVWLEVANISQTIPDAQEAMLQKAVEEKAGYKLGLTMDLSLYKFDTDTGTEKVAELSAPLSVTLGLPMELKNLGTMLADVDLLRIHEGKVAVLDGKLDKASFTVSFQTDKFSTYALTYTTHNLTKVDAKDATCTEAGNTAYYTCSHCDKLFADDKAAAETTKEAVVVAAAGHKLTKTEAKAATCETAGNTAYWTCDTCKKLFADAEGKTETTAEKTVVAAGHTLTKVEGKAATTDAEGSKEHYKCSACEALFADAEGKTAVTAADLVIAKLPKPADDSNPQTGDTAPVGMLMLLAIVSGMLLAGECLFGKKRFW